MADLGKAMGKLMRPLVAKYGVETVQAYLTQNGSQAPLPNISSGSATPTPTRCPTCNGQEFVLRKVAKTPPETCEHTEADHLLGRGICTAYNYKSMPCPECNTPKHRAFDDNDRKARWERSRISDYERAACTFALWRPGFNPEMHIAFAAAKAWAAGEGTPFLLLSGKVRGVGKTHLAIAAAGEVIESGSAAIYYVVNHLLDELRFTQRRTGPDEPDPPALLAVRRPVEQYPAVILDDLGAGKGSEWVDEQLFTVINERWKEGKRTLITTNCQLEDFEERVSSRLSDTRLATIIPCRGTDVRKLERR